MTPNELFMGIDGPLLREQRIAILNMLARNTDKENQEVLMGITNFLDNVADIAHDFFGKDCLMEDPE